MALVGQVATVAQLVGVDAFSLISMIADAAQTVRRNRATCRQLARRVEMIGGLLRRLHDTDAQLMQLPETRSPVEALEETLRRAYLLVRSCLRRGYAYRCFMGARHADELREVQGEIGFYLQLFPLVSYVDATLNWRRHTPLELPGAVFHPSWGSPAQPKLLKYIACPAPSAAAAMDGARVQQNADEETPDPCV